MSDKQQDKQKRYQSFIVRCWYEEEAGWRFRVESVNGRREMGYVEFVDVTMFIQQVLGLTDSVK